VQPTEVLRRLPRGIQIPGMRAKLLRILEDCGQQDQLAASCERIVAQDAQELALDLFRTRRGALRISDVQEAGPEGSGD
jgi:hypothetical protein